MKKGNPEDLSIRLLREILDEMGEPYCKSWKKGVLIEKVRPGREKANNTRCTASVRNTVTTGQERTIGHSSDSDSADSFTATASINSTSTSSSFRRVQCVVRQTQILYYFDEKKERLIHLLLLVLFIIDLLRAYMPNSLYVYVIYTLILIQATLVFEEIICFFSSFIALLMMLLTCSMFAQVNVRSFCGDQYRHVLCCLLLVQLMREPSSHQTLLGTFFFKAFKLPFLCYSSIYSLKGKS